LRGILQAAVFFGVHAGNRYELLTGIGMEDYGTGLFCTILPYTRSGFYYEDNSFSATKMFTDSIASLTDELIIFKKINPDVTMSD